MDPRAQDFVERVLTWQSSHPRFARERARRMLRLGTLFLGLCLGAVMWRLAHFDVAWFLSVLRGESWPAVAAYLILIALVAFIATGVLVVRVSVSGRLPDSGTEAHISNGAYAAGILGAALAGAVLYALPQLLPAGTSIGAELRQLAVVLAFLPYVLTLVLLEWLGPCQDEQGRRWRRNRGWLWLFWVGGGLTGTVFIASLDPSRAARFAAWPPLEYLPILGPWLKQHTGAVLQQALQFLSALTLVPTLYALGEWTLSGIPEERTAHPRRTGRSVWRRFLDFLKRLFTRSAPPNHAEGNSAEVSPPKPEWLKALLEQDPPPPGVIRFDVSLPRKATRSAETSDLDPTGDYDMLFAGRRPSRDQKDALLHFIAGHSALYHDAAQADRQATADFFVEGPPAAGKTQVLVACAAFAAVARGERICLLVPDDAARDDLLTRLQQVLTFSDLHWLIRAEALAQGPHRPTPSDDSPLPDILVGTPEAWEAMVFGTPPDAEIRRMALGTRIWMIDDLASPRWTPTQSLHLPFLLDRQRLLLAAEHRRLQLVVAIRPLLKAARETLGRRLFSTPEGAAVIPHAQRLRPWTTTWPWHVSIAASDTLKALTATAGFCMRQAVGPLVFLEGASDEVRRETIEALRHQRQSGPPTPDVNESQPDPEVIAHLYEADPGKRGTWQAVFYRAADTRGLLPSLQARYGHASTVFFSVETRSGAHPGPALDLGQMPTFPILASQHSPALLVTHLRAAAPLLPDGIPVPRDTLSTYGFPPFGQIPSAAGPSQPAHSAWPKFALDPPELETDPGTARPDAGLWPMASACIAQPVSAKPVNPDEMLDPQLAFELSRDGATLLTGPLENTPVEDRLAHWIDPRGVELGATDLSRLSELRLRRRGIIYWASRIYTDRRNRRCIEGAFWKGTGHETYRPVLDVRIQPPPGASLYIVGPRLGGRPQLKSLDLHWQSGLPGSKGTSGPAPDPSAADRPPTFARRLHPLALVTLQGVATDRGHIDRYAHPVVFRYACSVSVLLFSPHLPEDADLQALLSAQLGGEWDTASVHADRHFWPEFTASLNQAVFTLAPQVHDYARIIAFRLPPPLGGAAVLWIEPLVTAGTVLQFTEALCHDPELAPLFADQATQALDVPAPGTSLYAAQASLDSEAARAALAQCFLGDVPTATTPVGSTPLQPRP